MREPTPASNFFIFSSLTVNHQSMAIRRFFPNLSLPVTAENSPAMIMSSQAITRSLIHKNHHVQLQTSLNSLKKFNPVNKVFEDEENGVICYKDEQGELICEGSDEGPRLTGKQEEVKLEKLAERSQGFKSMNLSTEALIVMMELKRLNSGKMISREGV